MYLNPQIHDTQDTFMIHVGYTGIHSRIRISSPTCGRAWMRAGTNLHHVSGPACIPHVSSLPLQIHVSRMYPACILHLRYVPIRIHLRYTCIPICIFEVSVYPACIPHVSSNHCRYIYPACILD